MGVLKKIGIFGGTFDPVHIGHLRMALELKQCAGFDELRLVPCHQPPHRGVPRVSSLQRAKMLSIALQNCKELMLDERELARDKPSYTFDTLQDFRRDFGENVSLTLCMGEDAFAGLATWHRWQEIIELAHVLVVARPGWATPQSGDVYEFLNSHRGQLSDIEHRPAGSIVLQTLRLLPISATEIRQEIVEGRSAQFLVPDGVWDYICDNQLYRH